MRIRLRVLVSSVSDFSVVVEGTLPVRTRFLMTAAATVLPRA